ncbi:copper chaperone PCu(A)C [Stappia sp. F7233]|uniref:Copper chaperone PCu(A)C n=1 Tax=Stappia albiluteola TaxID=2758565 RepID=A0A839AB25_9HYPH|nr:copper chaperone PCu(A)C [Stappia albiluteola]MBA5776335.1 copper chaperone PCu(A)C [Stappia albiluteola]
MRIIRFAALAFAACLPFCTALAGEASLGDLSISGAWARATPPWPVATLGFLTIANAGDDDRLMAVAAPVAGQSVLHRVVLENGQAIMLPQQEGIPLSSGETLDMARAGFHLMFIGLKEPLDDGTKMPVELTFEKAGKITVEFDIRKTPPAIAAAGAESAQDKTK